MATKAVITVAALMLSGWGASANAADNPHQAEIDRAAADKAIADAATAAANARTAQADADQAALKAKFGDSKGSGIEGTADVTATGAGGAEGKLLAARAVNELAAQFAGEMKEQLTGQPTVLLFTGTTVPDFQAYATFEAQVKYLKASADEAKKQASPQELAVAPALASVDAIGKLLSFAKTDYKFIAIDANVTDAMLGAALARELVKTARVELPAVFLPDLASGAQGVQKQLEDTLKLGAEARMHQKSFETRQANLEKAAGVNPTPSQKDAIDKMKQNAVIWKSVADGVDAWARQATTADDKGATPMGTILRQAAIKGKLDNGARLLVVQVHNHGGTGYTKKNLWSSLGKNPFYVMGGVVAGYTLYDGRSGTVISAAQRPYHGGYQSIDDVQDIVNKPGAKPDAAL